MSYKVTAADIGAVQLNETDTVRSVLQNIAIILSTRQGTCPLYRGFCRRSLWISPCPWQCL